MIKDIAPVAQKLWESFKRNNAFDALDKKVKSYSFLIFYMVASEKLNQEDIKQFFLGISRNSLSVSQYLHKKVKEKVNTH